MALVLADRVRETTTVVGTGTATLLGAVTGYQSFTAVGNANTTYYVIASQAANEWEVGIGTYTASGTTLSRDTVLSSSNAGALVNFSAGTKDIWVDYAAGKAVTTDTLAYPPAIGGTTPNAATFTTLTATGQTSLGGAAGAESLRVVTPVTTGRYLVARGAATNPDFGASGGALILYGGANSGIAFYSNGYSQAQFNIAHTASAVNFVQVTGAATGSSPIISAQGSDANVTLALTSKGTSNINFFTAGAGSRGLQVRHATGTLVNYPFVSGSATGAAPVLSVDGTDTNIDLALTPKGTGTVVANGPFTATGQTSLGGAAGSADAFRIYKDNTITGQTASFTAPALSFIPPQSGYGAGILRSSTQLFITTGNTAPLILQTASTLGFAGSTQAQISHTASAVNFAQITGGATGAAPTLSAQGSDANIDLNLNPKGTGQTKVTNSTSSIMSSVGQSGYGSFLAQGSTGNAAYYFGYSGSSEVGRITMTGNIDFGTSSSALLQLRVSNTASAVNYVQVTGAATGVDPVISAQGSDASRNLALTAKGTGQVFSTNAFVAHTAAVNNMRFSGGDTTGLIPRISSQGGDTNVGMALISKGTGAIDLAPGSSGVNISNGGTVTAITRTNSGGSTYSGIPTVAISAPTTAGGVQATVTTLVAINAATIANGGTGYTVNDVVTLVGGTFATTGSRFSVTSVSGGVVTGVVATVADSYSAFPTQPATTTGGTGTGLTLTSLLGFIPSSGFTITNAGSGYVEQPTVTFSGGGGSGAAAYATVGSAAVIRALGGAGSTSLDFFTPASISTTVPQLRIRDQNADSFPMTFNQNAGATFIAQGNANANFNIASNGTGSVRLLTNGGSLVEQLRVSHTASAVNFVQVTGAATGGTPVISAQGSDAGIALRLNAKGGSQVIFSGNGVNTAFQTNHVTNAVNFLQATPAATGAAPVLSAQGSDTNIPLVVQPKGTGALQAQLNDGTATGGNARGANAVDWQTSRNAAGQVASGTSSVLAGGLANTVSGAYAATLAGLGNVASGTAATALGGQNQTSSGSYSAALSGFGNSATGFFGIVAGGSLNSTTSNSAVTTQSATMNGTTAVTLSGSNAAIRVGQLVAGTFIAGSPFTYVAAISGTSLTLSQAASGSGTATISFFTPHGVVVGGGNNQATGAYSFIGGGGDAGTAGNRNVASGDWSTVAGGRRNTASGQGSFVGGGGYEGSSVAPNTASGGGSCVLGGVNNIASGYLSSVVGGNLNAANSAYGSVLGGAAGNTRGAHGYTVLSSTVAIAFASGVSQTALIVLARQTTDATATVITSDGNAASTTNQVILPNNSAYSFRGTVIANVTGAGNTKSWAIEGAIKRGANAGSTVLVGTPTVTSAYADVGAATWTIAVTADTTNGGLAVTFTGQAATTIRCVAKLETTEVTF